jgi:hypothetical protein
VEVSRFTPTEVEYWLTWGLDLESGVVAA